MSDLFGNADSSGWVAPPSPTWSIPKHDEKDAIIAKLVEALNGSTTLLESLRVDYADWDDSPIDIQIVANTAAIKSAEGK